MLGVHRVRGLQAGGVLLLLWLPLGVSCESPARSAKQPIRSPEPPAAAARASTAEPGRAEALQPAPSAGRSPKLPAAAGAVDTARLQFAGTERDADWLLKQLETATAMAFKPVGSTSTVFKTTLVGPIDAAFKASNRERPRGPASEVAAYRVSRCLGMDNVPPAVSRNVRASKLRAALEAEHAPQWPGIRERLGVQEDGVVRGAMIYWITDLTELDIDEAPGVERWARWLSQGGQLPPDRRPLAASIGTMVLFDYLIGNFDRWSGGNAKGNATGTAVYVRDHDMAFPPALDENRHRRLLDRALRVERVSRAFYSQLKGLTRECVAQELARDPLGAPDQLLGRRRMEALFDRRDTLITHIDSLARTHGVAQVLAFP